MHQVAGITMTDPWASRALRVAGLDSEVVQNVPVETSVLMDQITIEHHGPEKNYRPRLHLSGELRKITPYEALPANIGSITFRPGLAPIIDAFYEFDDEQLSELVLKGYFVEGFEPPAGMAGIEWALPTQIDALVLQPEAVGETPVVFVTVHGQTELVVDMVSSEYDLVEYFENRLTPEAQRESAAIVSDRTVPTRSSIGTPLFNDEEFQAPNAANLLDIEQRLGNDRRATNQEPSVLTQGLFHDLVNALTSKLDAEAAEAAAAAVESDPLSPQSLYQQRVAVSAIPDAPETALLTEESRVTRKVDEVEVNTHRQRLIQKKIAERVLTNFNEPTETDAPEFG